MNVFAKAQWNFITTFIKLFEPQAIEKQDGQWWIDADVKCIDLREWDTHKYDK